MSIPTPYEIKAVVDDLSQTFTAFKEENDRKLAALKAKSEPLDEDRLHRLNGEVDRLQHKLESMQAAAMRSPLAGDSNPHTDQQKSAFHAFVRKGIEAPGSKAMGVATDPDGGFAVPPVLNDRMIKVLFESSPIRQIASVVTVNSDALEMLVDRDETQTAWVAEQATRVETDHADLGKVRIPVHEMYAEPRITQKLLDDAAFDIEEWLIGKITEKMSRTESTAFVTGDGIGKPRGFTSYPVGAGWGKLEAVKTGVNGDWAASNPADSLFTLLHSLKSPYLRGATWVLGRAQLASIRRFKGSDGHYLWQPALAAGQPSTLLGYPVLMAEDMPVRATGSLSVAFGNFTAGYTIADRADMTLLRDPYTAKPYVKLYASKRVGGDVTDFDAIKLLQFSA